MRHLRRLSPVFAAALLALLMVTRAVTSAPALAQDPTSPGDITVSVSISEVSTQTGDKFKFTSSITNNGPDATPPLIANLNVVSLDQKTYVDPEDWSPQHALTVAPIAGGSSATQAWTVTPVLKGDVAVYVVVLPSSPDLATASSLVASPAVHVHVEEHRTLNPGGVLPVVLAVPAFLAVAFAGLRVARVLKTARELTASRRRR